MTLAAEQGFSVAKPWGDSQRYDVTVEHKGKFVRVQVKCTMARFGKKGYLCSFTAPGRAPYRAKEVDFFAILVIPEDVWYILPIAVILRLKVNILLAPRRKGQKYERYMEAWELLRGEEVRGGRVEVKIPTALAGSITPKKSEIRAGHPKRLSC
jgi:hypothetical protein